MSFFYQFLFIILTHRMLQAKQFGSKLIFDCSFDDLMRPQYVSDTSKQLTFGFSANRNHREPFDIHICTTNIEGETIKALKRSIPTLMTPSYPLEVHEDSYVNMFPKSQLVYLTPDSQNVLESFNPDDIYIVSGFIDKTNPGPVTMAKAKEQQLRTAWFPVTRYLQWKGSMNLPLNIIISILLDFKKTGDWNIALQHVPKRKFYQKRPEGRVDRRRLFSFKNVRTDKNIMDDFVFVPSKKANPFE